MGALMRRVGHGVLLLADGDSYAASQQDRVQFAEDRPLETSVRGRRTRGLGGAASRLEAHRVDARVAGSHPGVDPARSAARRDALVDAMLGRNSACSTRSSLGRGAMPACNRIAWTATCARRIPTSR